MNLRTDLGWPCHIWQVVCARPRREAFTVYYLWALPLKSKMMVQGMKYPLVASWILGTCGAEFVLCIKTDILRLFPRVRHKKAPAKVTKRQSETT